MSYPGNATLTREMQERILSTFQQTLTAAAAGNREEATLGCDFILRLDSLFGPARQLQERLAGGEGPVVTEDLALAAGLADEESSAAPAPAQPPAPPVAPAATPPAEAEAPPAAKNEAAAPPDIDDLSDLDLEMGLSDPVPAPAQPAPSQPTVDDLDDLDLGLEPESGGGGAPPAAPEVIAPPAPSPSQAAPDSAPTGPTEPEPTPEGASAEPEAPEPEAPATPPASAPTEAAAPMAESPAPETDRAETPSVPDSPSTEPPAAEPSAAEPPVSGEAPPVEAPAAAPATPETAEVPMPEAEATTPSAAEPTAEPVAPALEELDDLELGEPQVGEAPAAPEAPIAPESEATPEAGTEPPPAAAAPGPETDAAEPEPTAEPEPAAAAPDNVEIPLDGEPAAQLDSESQQRIDNLLAEGQEAFEGGEYQGAIDAWSRIFLIDIDHAEANRRIEEARKLKAEADREVEEKFHEGLNHLEAGDTDGAAASFRTVLEMQPSHLQARDYLEKLDAGEVPVPAERAQPAEAKPDEEPLEPADLDEEGEAGEAPKPKPDRGTKAVGERVVSVKKSPFKSKGFLAIAAAGLIAVLGGGWYLFQNWSSLFPNSAQEAPAPAAPNPVERAQGLHAEGKTPIAIAQLRRLPPDSPQYDEAQALIAQWESAQTPAEAGPEGPSPQELARREALIAEAAAAAERREFMLTSELLSQAATIAPLSGTEVQLLARADEQLQELQNFITIFREGEWELGLRDLWLLHESDPANRDVVRLLVDSYYNLGLRALQRKDVKEAAGRFAEALKLSPDDPELLRLAGFAATYETRSTDLLFRIYVKYHPFR